MNEGKMIDASFTVAPRQRNTRDENKKIKEDNGDELWNDKPNKKKHKDIDARWTKKNGETFYGYKNHAKVDSKSKFIDKYKVRMLLSTIHKSWTIYWKKKTKDRTFTQTVHIQVKTRRKQLINMR